jgi:short-subunit dehydrogenase
MAKSTFSFVSILALLLLAAFAVFLKVDCDFFLYFAPYDPTTKPFQGQVVWITGASSGIGASLARDLSAAGAQLVLTARREDMLNLVSAECVQAGGLKPLVLAFDVTDETAQKAFYTTVKETFGRVDKLILNAGRSQRALALDTPTELSREVFDLNLFSVISLGQMVLADMVAQGGGHLVLMSSVAGLFGLPGQSTYSATKFALNGYYDALRAEYHTKNITVSVVCPGPVTSEIGDKAWKAPGYNVKVRDLNV